MSENLELVRSIYADWERGDFRADWADPEIEIASPESVDVPSTHGRSAMAAGWRDTLEAWENLSVTAKEYRELDEERIMVLHRVRARGKMSGLEVDESMTEGALLFDVRDGKVARLVLYMNRDNALADLGLEE
jgi:ketosteroid isomerase-like protein